MNKISNDHRWHVNTVGKIDFSYVIRIVDRVGIEEIGVFNLQRHVAREMKFRSNKEFSGNIPVADRL